MKPRKFMMIIIFSISILLSACSSQKLPPGYEATLENLPVVSTVETINNNKGTENLPAADVVSQEMAATDSLVVTSTAEDGPGTLRAAVEMASPGDVITFDTSEFPPQDPAVIHFTIGKPISLIQGNITIDASNAGVILSGEGVPQTGIFINSGGNFIMGLKIVHFEQTGILIFGEDNPDAFSDGNIIGGDRNVGNGPYGQGNCFGENGTAIQIESGGHGNIITGNLIGVDADMNDIGNVDSSIRLHDGAYENIIGPDNIIANHPNLGIMIEGSSTLRNTVTRSAFYNCGDTPLLLLNGGNHEQVCIIRPETLNLDCSRGSIAAEISPSNIITIEIFSSDESGMKVFEGSAQIDIQDESDNGENYTPFNYEKGEAFQGDHLYLTGHTADGETSAFSEPIVCR